MDVVFLVTGFTVSVLVVVAFLGYALVSDRYTLSPNHSGEGKREGEGRESVSLGIRARRVLGAERKKLIYLERVKDSGRASYVCEGIKKAIEEERNKVEEFERSLKYDIDAERKAVLTKRQASFIFMMFVLAVITGGFYSYF
ncbi:hypothetical protein GCM10027294_21360 [Marinactinospora endophytica]